MLILEEEFDLFNRMSFDELFRDTRVFRIYTPDIIFSDMLFSISNYKVVDMDHIRKLDLVIDGELTDRGTKFLAWYSNYDFNYLIYMIENSYSLDLQAIKSRIDIIIPLDKRAQALSITKNPNLLRYLFS